VNKKKRRDYFSALHSAQQRTRSRQDRKREKRWRQKNRQTRKTIGWTIGKSAEDKVFAAFAPNTMSECDDWPSWIQAIEHPQRAEDRAGTDAKLYTSFGVVALQIKSSFDRLKEFYQTHDPQKFVGVVIGPTDSTDIARRIVVKLVTRFLKKQRKGIRITSK